MKVKIYDKNLWKNYFAILGVIGIFTGFITIFVSIEENDKPLIGYFFLFSMIFIFFILWFKANKNDNIHLKINDLNINIFYGNIFECNDLKLIPFNEYFDTIVDNKIIAKNTLNGKFILENYPSIKDLDLQIESELIGKSYSLNDLRLIGKKKKYELGTTIEINNEYLLTAFTHFNDENEAFISKIGYLQCLDKLWKEINRIYAQRDINIPLLGSGISRIENGFKLQDYLEQILNSLKLSNINNAHNTKINIVLHESVKKEINLFEIESKF